MLLDSRCPPLHLPSSLCAHLNVPTSLSLQHDPSLRSKQSKLKAPRIILVLTKVDISGPARTTSWTSFLNANYPGVPVVPVESYTPKSAVEQGPTRYEPHLPITFRERLVHTLRDVHEQLLQPPQWVTASRPGESEEDRLHRVAKWKPKVKTVIDWDGVLEAKGKLVGKAIGGVAVPKGQDIEHDTEGTEDDEGDVINTADSEEEQTNDTFEWKEPEFLTIGVIGRPNPSFQLTTIQPTYRSAKRWEIISVECDIRKDTGTCLTNSWQGMWSHHCLRTRLNKDTLDKTFSNPLLDL